MTEKASDLLRAAKAKIENPICWIRDCIARDSDGNEVWPYPNENIAVCFCAEGAVRAVSREFALLSYLMRGLDRRWQNAYSFNDDPATTHADVLALFDRAIALAEADEVAK